MQEINMEPYQDIGQRGPETIIWKSLNERSCKFSQHFQHQQQKVHQTVRQHVRSAEYGHHQVWIDEVDCAMRQDLLFSSFESVRHLNFRREKAMCSPRKHILPKCRHHRQEGVLSETRKRCGCSGTIWPAGYNGTSNIAEENASTTCTSAAAAVTLRKFDDTCNSLR